MRRALLAVPTLLLACGAPLPPPPPPVFTPVPPATPTATASAEPVSPPRPAARLGPPLDAAFGHAVSCQAPGFLSLQLWSVGKGLLGICGFAVDAAGVFHVSETGTLRLAPEVFKDIPLGGAREALFGIFDVSGPDLDHLDATVTELMTRSGFSYHFRKEGKQWKRTGTTAFNGGEGGCGGNCVEIDKHALFERPEPGGVGRFVYLDEHRGWLPARAKPEGCDEPVRGFSLLMARGKELWGVGAACGKTAVQRWTIGATDTRAERIDLPAREVSYGRTYPISGDRMIYANGDGRDLVLFDGKRWTPIATFPDSQGVEVREVHGKIWVQRHPRLYRLEGQKLEEVPLPEEGMEILRFTPGGEVLLWTGKGLHALDGAGVWHRVSLPRGVSDIYDLDVVGGRWVFRSLHGPDKDEQRLFISGVSGPPLQIIDPHAAISPIAFVRPMRPDCENPFAMLYKLSKVAPKDYDFPATKTALAGRPDLQAGRYGEVAALGDRYLVAQFSGPRARQQLAEVVALVTKKVQGSKPQLLCADAVKGGLPVTRDVVMK